MDELEWQLLEERSELLQVNVGGIELKTGDRVRLRPRAGGDIFDLALSGQVAIIESIEQDYESNIHLAVVLALRPRRRGTPPRQTQVVQTQIILAIVGAVVMLVVGTSLARAFGIVGAAGLVRYRAKIEDPKDAGVMLSTLAVGLASGVGLWMLAAFSAAFVLAVLWVVESFEPQARQLFMLHVKAKDPQALRPKLESLLGRSRLAFELRSSTAENLTYEMQLPLDKKVDRLSNAILKIA